MRGVKIKLNKWGSQWLYELRNGVADIYEVSGLKEFGKIKVETFIKVLSEELDKRADWPPEEYR